jgi:Tol biopolymer transport system component
MSRTPLAAFITLLVFASAPARAITIEQAMADPDWIGSPVQHPFWSVDGRSLYYNLKRKGSPVRDLHRVDIADGKDTIVDPQAMASADGADAVFDRQHVRAAFVRNGDVFIRDVASGRLTQVTRTPQQESSPQFTADGRALHYRSGIDWFVYDITGGIGGPAAIVKAEKDPDAKTPDDLSALQLKYFSTLREIKGDHDAQKKNDQDFAKADPGRSPQPFYIGDDVKIEGTSFGPDGRWMLVFTTPKSYDKGKSGKLQHFVTESGYEEQEDERTRVGRNDPAPQSMLLLDLRTHEQYKLAAADLPGIHDDPLKSVREENEKATRAKGDQDKSSKSGDGAHEDVEKKDTKNDKPKERAVRIVSDAEDGGGGGIEWSDDGRSVAIQIRAIDNKDRWITTVDFGAHKLITQHRLTDPAWINWNFNEFGWEKDDRTLWYVSEESGYAQLYAKSAGGKANALTSGKFEVSGPVVSPDGKWFYVRANAEAPYSYDVYRVAVGGGALQRITSVRGMQEFGLSPDGKQIAILRSDAYVPPQLALASADGGAVHDLTHKRTAE